MSNLLIRLFEVASGKRKTFFVIIGLVLAIALFFASRLRLKEDISAMMPRDPKIEKMNQIIQHSRFSDKLVVNVFLKDSSAPSDPELLIAFADSLSDALKPLEPGYIEQVRSSISDHAVADIFASVNDHLPVFLTEEDYERLDTILRPENLRRQLENNYKLLVSPASLVIKKTVIQDPLGISGNVLKKLRNLEVEDNFDLYDNHILTKDRKNLLLFVVPANPPNETGINSMMLKKMDSVFAVVGQRFDHSIEAQYFGAAAMAAGNAERIKSDLMITITLAVAVLVLFMGVFFKRAGIVLIIFLPVLIGGIISLAVMYFLKKEVSAIALGMGSVLLGITVDYSLHIFTHYRSTGSVRAVLKDLPVPLMLSGFITASSFLCLMFVKSDALKDLGLFAAISVINALLAGLIVLPHFLRKTKRKEKGPGASISFIERFTAYRYDRNKGLLVVIIVVTVVSLFTAGNVRFETDMMKMNYVSDKLYEAEKNLYKISNIAHKSLYVVASGNSLEETLEANEGVAAALARLKEEGVVRSVAGVNDFLISQRMQQQRIDRWNQFWTAERKDSLSKHLLDIGADYKFSAQAFTPFLNSLRYEYKPVAITDLGEMKRLFFDEYLSERSSMVTLASLLKVDPDKKDLVQEYIQENDHVTILDRQYMTSRFVELMRDDFNTLEALSLGLVFLVLVLSYGRLELGVIAFVPMILSWLWTLGLMGLLGIKFNIINIIISTFILGLGIDYSIFIMSGLMDEYAKGAKHLATFKTSIFLSAFTSITGIGALIFAEHPALRSVAVLSIIGMCSVITISFVLQPLLFRLLITDRVKKGLNPVTAESILVSIWVYSIFITGCSILTILATLVLPVLPLRRTVKKKTYHRLLTGLARFLIRTAPRKRLTILDKENENFDKPAIVISNHQSFLDILMMLAVSPRLILMTNHWVWNSPIIGPLVRYADSLPAFEGIESNTDLILDKLEEGFSIVIFPEGTRSADGKIHRFHKGAFYLAEKYGIDILPVVIHGAGETIAKGDLMVNNTGITLRFLPRITPESQEFGTTYQEKSKAIRKYFLAEYQKLKEDIETPAYLKNRLIQKYIYKGPVLEWYCRIKLRLENNYALYDRLLPHSGKIVDVGCGYGFMSYMLAMLNDNRQILGMDYDSEKVEVASHCYRKPANVKFEIADVTRYQLPEADAFVLSDVLHYLSVAEQKEVLKQCAEKLNPGGILLIREGDKDHVDRHNRTRITEFFSTRIMRFNKVHNRLTFLSGKELEAVCTALGLSFEVADKGSTTSNSLFVARKTIAEYNGI